MGGCRLAGVLAGIGFTLAGSVALAASPPDGITTTQTKLGTVYTNAAGMTVYEFRKDNPQSPASACNGPCAALWPPVAAPAGFTPDPPWGAITRQDGSRQLTYQGYPLYTWSKDAKPGDVTGQGFKSNWRAASPGTTPLAWTH
jgi:predicted lipoprotein with Yx(FWY)xxD motif